MSWIRRLFLGDDRPLWDIPCKTCEALREQLNYERSVNEEMLETLTSLLKPVPVAPQSSLQNLSQQGPKGVLWSRRRAELEKQDRESMRIKVNSPVVGRPDSESQREEPRKPKTIDQLELELGVAEVSGPSGGE